VFAVNVSSIQRTPALSQIELARLSAGQAELLAVFHRRWEGVRMSTARADRIAAEEGIHKAYRGAALAPPERVVWCDGPLDVARSAKDASLQSAGENVKAVVVDRTIREATHAADRSVGAEVRSQISHVFRRRPIDPVSAAVAAAVTLDNPLVRERPISFVRNILRRLRWGLGPAWMEQSLRNSSFSQHEAPSLAALDFLYNACGLSPRTEAAPGLMQTAANVGWIIPHSRVCWLVDRPTLLRTDDRHRLHNAAGPAIAFADGWSFHAWKGVQVAAWMIERPQDITARAIDREHDPTVRRCMIDIMTPARFIREGDAVTVAEDETGILWNKTWTAWDAWAAVQVQNGTPEPDGTYKQYFLQVPPTVRSARQAVAWTYGLSEFEYAALKQRT
jgi:hypothetical protein